MTKGQPSPTTEPDWVSKLSPGGTGLRVFHPLVVALAAGANFIARGFSGDPNGLAGLLAEAIRTPGFSFVEVLSPCVTYRPEQREWKGHVRPSPVAPTDDPARAARRLLTDDGFNLGVLYRGNRKPYQPPVGRGAARAADLEQAFER
jgi:2-oxoglutarate ferredoxin oxidoreductase subunit beta